MLTQMQVFNKNVRTAPLPIGSGTVETDPIQILDIQGLGPVAANVNTEKFGTIDGEWYAGSSVPKRVIVITVGYNPDWATQSISSLRALLYRYFMPKALVRLQFDSTDIPTCDISGYVESCEPNIFSRDPQMVVTIICNLPYFKAVTPTVVTGVSHGLTETNVATQIDYAGSVDAGFVLDISAGTDGSGNSLGSGGKIQVTNEAPDLEGLVVTFASITSSQYVSLSTVAGSKFARTVLMTGGLPGNLLGSVSTSSQWLNLKSGTNMLTVLTATAGMAWTLRYSALFGGL